MKKFFSPSSGGFYPEVLRDDYERAGSWPEDAIEVDSDTEGEIRVALDSGGQVLLQEGQIEVFAPEPETIESIRARALVAIRKERAPIMATLDGITGRMDRASRNMTLSQADRDAAAIVAAKADAAIAALLDITTLPALASATTYEAMRQAVKARYAAIVAAAPAAVKAAFLEAVPA